MQVAIVCILTPVTDAVLQRVVCRATTHVLRPFAGFYVALAQGLYRASNITVDFLSPAQDAYKNTPASRVASGQALLAVAPSETVISYNSQSSTSTKPRLTVLDHVAHACDMYYISETHNELQI